MKAKYAIALAVLAWSAAAGADPPEARLRLGHYSTPDGLFGIVLDRTASPPRARIDGKTEIVELAVNRIDQDETMLLSADESLMIHIDEYGWLQLVPEAANPKVLRRDGAGEKLGAPARPAPDLAAATQSATQACAAPVRFELAGTPGATATPLVRRATAAIVKVCRDNAGRTAVKQKLHVVRIGAAKATNLALDASGTLLVQGELEGEAMGPFRSEIQKFVERTL